MFGKELIQDVKFQMANLYLSDGEAVIGIAFGILIGMVAIMGNGLVLYAAYRKNNSMKFSVLRDLDIVIKSLAINDLLIGLVGFPARAFSVWMRGEFDLDEDHNEGKNCRI